MAAPPDASAGRSSDPAAGFHVGAPLDESLGGLSDVFIPVKSARHYVADPVITDPAAIRAAVPTLIGQPVLVTPRRGPPVVGTLAELRSDGFYVYAESKDGGWSGTCVAYDEIAALGRAWLKLAPTPAAEPTRRRGPR